MAIPKVEAQDVNRRNACPKCSKEMLVIDGNFIEWHTCPACKFKKLVEKKNVKKTKVVSLK